MHTHTRILTHTHTRTHTRTLMHTHAHSCTHTHTHTRTLMHTHTLTHSRTLTHTHAHTHTHSHARSHTFMLTLMHTHEHTHTRVHTHAHTLMHTHVHTHATHAHAHSCTLTNTYTHVCAHALMHTHSCTLTHTHSHQGEAKQVAMPGGQKARGGHRLGSHAHTLGQPRLVGWRLKRRDIPFPWDLRSPLGTCPEAHVQQWEDMWTVVLVSRHREPGTIRNHSAVALREWVPEGSVLWNKLMVVSVVSDSWDPMDCSPPGSSVHGISQARILEWVAISFSRGSS